MAPATKDTKATNTKERIIAATIGLINESDGDIASISTRTIAERAEVGVGMVNYHFQTKDRLIEICVERIIGDVISEFRPEILASQQSPAERVGFTARLVADFLYDNEAMSRISILSDLQHPKDDDNTMLSVRGIEYTIGDTALGEVGSERRLAAFALVSVMQALFLRPHALGLDMRDKQQRDELLNQLVELIFGR